MLKFRILGVVALAVVSSAAAAQDMPSVLPNDYVLKDILNRQRVDSAIGAPSRSGSTPGARSPSPARPAGKVTTAYRASPQVSARVVEQYSKTLATRLGPVQGPKAADALKRTDPLRCWSRLVEGDGLRSGDVADAVAGWWVLSWVIANGGDSNRAQVLGVREQARAMLAASPGLARLDDTRRQEMAEVMMLDFVVQQAAYVGALQRGDQAEARRQGDEAAARFQRQMGVDLRRVRLTDRGFAKRG
jgi:hypothetical protein